MIDASPALRIVAVVVTLNRLGLLKRCVAALRRQTRPLDAIVIVDNGSSDGTLEWVADARDLDVIRQGNLGASGGQHVGIRRAVELGADWIWCMDDDGFAGDDALALLAARTGRGDADWLNSLVVDVADRERLAFGMKGFGLDAARRARAREVIVGEANPFNCTLLSRSLVATIGLPAVPLFIWGDETEYQRRAKAAGMRIVTVPASEFFHPASAVPLADMPLAQAWKYYYQVRNKGAVADPAGNVTLSARAARKEARRQAKTLLSVLLTRPGDAIAKWKLLRRGAAAARRNDLTRRYP